MEVLQRIHEIVNYYGIDNFVSLANNMINGHGKVAFDELIKMETVYTSKSRNVLSIRFNSPYISARVIGKQGCIIRKIQYTTSTEIISPRCGIQRRPSINDAHFDSEAFTILAKNINSVNYARILIILIGMFFQTNFKILITPGTGEICERFEVEPSVVPYLLFDHGERIIKIKSKLSVRIVSPKPYCPPCYFYIIGFPANVQLAKIYIMEQVIQNDWQKPIQFNNRKY